MLIVRETFSAKPGQAGKFAKLFKRAFAGMGDVRVLTDYIGHYNTVVMEMAVQDLAEFERKYEEYRAGQVAQDPQLAEELKHYTELYLTGKREIFKVVE